MKDCQSPRSMLECLMPLRIDSSKATRHFFAQQTRCCPACGHEQRYNYKSSGRYFYCNDGLHYVDGQIVYCYNGACPLRFKPMHPPEELSLAAPLQGHGFDVIATIGQLRYGEGLKRSAIHMRLAQDYPALKISERQVQELWELYGELVSGSTLTDHKVIAKIKRGKVMVLSLDGAKPIRNNDSVWFVRDVVSGITLAAQAMTSCTTEALVKLLEPINVFSRGHKIPVVGVVSDKEAKILAAVRRVFPRARHQYCQLHYVTNLAKPLAKQDQELLKETRKAMRGKVGEIQKAIKEDTGPGKALSRSQSEVLVDLCEGIRSALRFGGKQPFEPPGLKLIEQLTGLRELICKMKREKGGLIFVRWTSFSSLRHSSSQPNARFTGFMTTSGTCRPTGKPSSPTWCRVPRRPPEGPVESSRATIGSQAPKGRAQSPDPTES